MGFMKRSVDSIGKLVIKDLLHQKVGGSSPARGQKTIHASDLTKQSNQWGVAYCPREVRLREVTPNAPKRPKEFLPVATAVTFNEGRDKQWRLNNDWLLDIMWGAWNCRGCANRVAWGKRPESCSECESITNLWEYEEIRILDKTSKTSGGLDAIVDVGRKKKHIIEVKILKSDDFKTLHAPLSEHRVRTRLYLRQVAGSKQKFAKEIETDYAHVLYIMRGHGCKQEDGRISPFKEYIVERDDSEVEHYLGMAHALTLSRKFNHIFPAGLCKTQMDARAQKCPMAKTCFAEHTATITWMKNGKPLHTGDNIQYITNGEELNECSS